MKGTAELSRALLNLPHKVEQRVLRKAAIAGARIVRNAVQALAPIADAPVNRKGGVVTVPGTLRRAVVLKYAPEKSGIGKSTYVVTVRHGKRYQKANRDAYYWLWVEQGHAVIRGKMKVGQAAPRPFFVPAYRATADQAQAKMRDVAEAQVTALINET